MLQDVSKVPEGVPVRVYNAALDIEADLVDPTERDILWRIVNLPEVWKELLRKNVKKNGSRRYLYAPQGERLDVLDENWELALTGFLRLAFEIARQPHLAVTGKAWREQIQMIETKVSMLRKDHEVLSRAAIETRSNGSTDVVAPIEKIASLSLDLAEAWAVLLKEGPRPHIVERTRTDSADPRALDLGLHLLRLCEDHFSQPVYSVAMRIANAAINKGNPITEHTLRMAHRRKSSRHNVIKIGF